jgi:crotonobetaine/carnitine-CoA ligase
MWGGRCVIRKSFKTQHFWSDVAVFGCKATTIMPPMARFLLVALPTENDATTPMRYVAMIVPMIAELEEFKRRFGVLLRTGYNMTEISMPIQTGYDVSSHLSAGVVRPGYECRIVGVDDEELPVGAAEELVVRASEPWTLMAGYWNQPEKTVEAWRNQWFHTGSTPVMCSSRTLMATSTIWTVLRTRSAGLKDSLRRRGENISSVEVEGAILEHPRRHRRGPRAEVHGSSLCWLFLPEVGVGQSAADEQHA